MLKPSGLFQISFIGKEEIKRLDFSTFEMFMEDVANDGYKNREDTLIFAINGYDEDERELYDILEVRKYFRELLKKHPYIFYYLEEEMWQLPYLCGCVNIAYIEQAEGEKQVAFRKDNEFIRNIMNETIDYCMDNGFENTEAFIKILMGFMLEGRL